MKSILYLFCIVCFSSCYTKSVAKKEIVQVPDTIKVNKKLVFSDLVLKSRIQSIDSVVLDSLDVFDQNISSPKSAIYSADGTKFYINSLEGYQTIVYDATSLKKIKVITHNFTPQKAFLFKDNENTAFDYKFKQEKENFNIFKGKPVESCLSHNGKYLWVTYYRRDFDDNAESPSAVAVINTQNDEIVRVIPSGPLPKMIACSPDNKYIAVTHWGDNTVGIIDISGNDVFGFKYINHIDIDGRLSLNFDSNQKVNRDNECGNCLRGTVFSPDGKFLLIAKMGGNGIAIIETTNFKYIGTIVGSKRNLRHIVINNDALFVSSNKFGAVQKADLKQLLQLPFKDSNTIVDFNDWKTTEVGYGARTIDVTPDGKYIFACINNECKIVVIDAQKMEVIYTKPVSKFPVGMALSASGTQLIITSQGKDSVLKSGNAVSVFEVVYKEEVITK